MSLRRRIRLWLFELKLRLQVILKRLGIDIASLNYAQKWVVMGTFIGVVGGLGAIVFTLLLHLFLEVFEPLFKCCIIVAPAIGGLVSGLLVYTFAPEAEGHGTDAVIESVHRRWAKIRARVPVIKTLASAITIGSGGSAGKEGPIAQIAAGIGSVVAQILRLSPKDRRLLVVSGVAAGIGAIFKAPLGAAIFSSEVLYTRDYEVDALMPSIIASIVAYAVYGLYAGWTPVLIHPGYTFNLWDLPFMIVLGVVSGLVALIYVTVFYDTRDRLFKKISIPNHVKPLIGGLVVGAMGLFYPQVLGGGYDVMNQLLSGRILDVQVLFMLVVLKILATSFTISSGGSGGVFAPSLFIGASLGALLGVLFQSLFPGLTSPPSAYALIGMAAFFSGAAKVPLTSIIMVVEMTGGYSAIIVITFASAISYMVSGVKSIYEKQIPQRVA